MRGRKRCMPRIAYLSTEYRDVTWDGVARDHLWRTFIFLWNAGARRITANDLSSDAPIIVEFDGEILSAWNLPTRDVCADVTQLGPSRLRLTFSLLNGVFDGLRLRDLPDMAAFSYDSFNYEHDVNPEDFDILNRSRGLCLDVIHTSQVAEPRRISGSIGAAQLEVGSERQGVKPKPRRFVWLTALAALIGALCYEWVKDDPAWLDNFEVGHGTLWKVLMGLSIALLAGVLAYFGNHFVATGRDLNPLSGNVGPSPESTKLWDQRVPFALRGRADIKARYFEVLYKDHLAR